MGKDYDAASGTAVTAVGDLPEFPGSDFLAHHAASWLWLENTTANGTTVLKRRPLHHQDCRQVAALHLYRRRAQRVYMLHAWPTLQGYMGKLSDTDTITESIHSITEAPHLLL